MQPKLPPQLELPGQLAVALFEAAGETAKAGMRVFKPRARRRQGQTLKPGVDTPLWNELHAALRAQFKRHGEKANLGRLLGLPRQRIHDLIMARRHLPDAERTLWLLVWLHARRQSGELPARDHTRLG